MKRVKTDDPAPSSCPGGQGSLRGHPAPANGHAQGLAREARADPEGRRMVFAQELESRRPESRRL